MPSTDANGRVYAFTQQSYLEELLPDNEVLADQVWVVSVFFFFFFFFLQGSAAFVLQTSSLLQISLSSLFFGNSFLTNCLALMVTIALFRQFLFFLRVLYVRQRHFDSHVQHCILRCYR